MEKNRKHIEATAINSPEGEQVPFQSPVITEGPVEVWMLQIEHAMKYTVHKLLFATMTAMKSSKKRQVDCGFSWSATDFITVTFGCPQNLQISLFINLCLRYASNMCEMTPSTIHRDQYNRNDRACDYIGVARTLLYVTIKLLYVTIISPLRTSVECVCCDLYSEACFSCALPYNSYSFRLALFSPCASSQPN